MSKVYLPSTGAAAGSPAFSAPWEDSASADRLAAVLTRISSPMTNVVVAGDGTAANDFLSRQYILGPLNAGLVFTTGDTINIQVRGKEAAAGNNQALMAAVRLIASDFSTLRATLKGTVSNPGTEYTTTITNRTWTTTVAATTYTTVANDYLVIEIGFDQQAAGSAGNNTLVFGDDSATDLPADETTTTADNPYVEFPSTTITLVAAVGSSTRLRSLRRRRR